MFLIPLIVSIILYRALLSTLGKRRRYARQIKEPNATADEIIFYKQQRKELIYDIFIYAFPLIVTLILTYFIFTYELIYFSDMSKL